MKYNQSYYCLLLFLLLGCNLKITKDAFLTDFNKTIHLTMEKSLIKSSNIGEIVDMLVIDSFLVSNEIFTSKIFKLYSIQTGKLISNFIDKGRGPNEMLFPHILNCYDATHFTTFDNNNKELIYFSLDDFCKLNFRFNKKEKIEFNSTKSFAAVSYLLNDSTVLCTGFFEKSQYILYNLKSKSVKYFLDYPSDPKHKGETNEIKGTAFQGQISVKPDRKKFANATGAILEICEFNDNEIKRLFRKIYYFPEYKVIQNHAAFVRTQPYAFHSITSTDSYIYMIYSGRSMQDFGEEYYAGNNLLVFDWNGNPVTRFVLDRYLKNFTLNEKEMKIYGYSTNPNSGEPEIITYQIPKM